MIRDRILAWIGGGTSVVLAAALAFVWITKGAEVRALKDANGKLAHRLELHAADLAAPLAMDLALWFWRAL